MLGSIKPPHRDPLQMNWGGLSATSRKQRANPLVEDNQGLGGQKGRRIEIIKRQFAVESSKEYIYRSSEGRPPSAHILQEGCTSRKSPWSVRWHLRPG